MHCCIVKYFAFNCTRTALQSRAVFRPYLHGKYFAVQQQQQQPAEWAGFVMAICICHGSFPIFCPPPLPFCASTAFVGIWRRFIDCVVFGRTIFVYICPPACQAARLPGLNRLVSTHSVSFYVLFLEHFQQNTLRFSFLQQLRCAFKWHLKYLSWVLAHNFINAARACSAASCLCLLPLYTYFACLPLALS